ncbi:hypothetical protein H920_06620 [Fukomys damarensis]|uniref:Uncharacterized protein n=1 Tax=Fukomys damarensis TaxID=885580 RepID=A0A091EA00_FUKDA|nr:hypothetical protein H920_06620 [Fukomys damarensis]
MAVSQQPTPDPPQTQSLPSVRSTAPHTGCGGERHFASAVQKLTPAGEAGAAQGSCAVDLEQIRTHRAASTGHTLHTVRGTQLDTGKRKLFSPMCGVRADLEEEGSRASSGSCADFDGQDEPQAFQTSGWVLEKDKCPSQLLRSLSPHGAFIYFRTPCIRRLAADCAPAPHGVRSCPPPVRCSLTTHALRFPCRMFSSESRRMTR